MTAEEMVSSLRTEVQSLVNNANIIYVDGVTFSLADGREKIVELNDDKSWRVKPVEDGDLVKIDWKDKGMDYTSTARGIFTIAEQVETIDIDPTEVVSFRFNYKEKVASGNI
jgi:hypothetical protein